MFPFVLYLSTIQLQIALSLNHFDLQRCFTPFWKPQKEEFTMCYKLKSPKQQHDTKSQAKSKLGNFNDHPLVTKKTGLCPLYFLKLKGLNKTHEKPLHAKDEVCRPSSNFWLESKKSEHGWQLSAKSSPIRLCSFGSFI